MHTRTRVGNARSGVSVIVAKSSASVVNKHGTDYSTGVLEKRLCRRRVASAFNREQGGRIRCACHVP